MAGQMGPGAAAVMGAGLPGGMHGGGLAMGLGGLRGGPMDVNMGLAPGSPPTPDSDGLSEGERGALMVLLRKLLRGGNAK